MQSVAQARFTDMPYVALDGVESLSLSGQLSGAANGLVARARGELGGRRRRIGAPPGREVDVWSCRA